MEAENSILCCTCGEVSFSGGRLQPLPDGFYEDDISHHFDGAPCHVEDNPMRAFTTVADMLPDEPDDFWLFRVEVRKGSDEYVGITMGDLRKLVAHG
jgi:hypothetical protein